MHTIWLQACDMSGRKIGKGGRRAGSADPISPQMHERIVARMKQLGVTDGDLAEKVGVDRSVIAKIRKRTLLSSTALSRIVSVLELDRGDEKVPEKRLVRAYMAIARLDREAAAELVVEAERRLTAVAAAQVQRIRAEVEDAIGTSPDGGGEISRPRRGA